MIERFTIIKSLKASDWVKETSEHYNVYLVGGMVRDMILGKQSKDIDLLIDASSLDSVREILEKHGSINVVGKSFSVLKFKPYGWNDEYIDIAVPRKDVKIGNSHKDFKVINGVSVKEDLKRRDFTINSVAINLITQEIIDPFGGIMDMLHRTIRATDINAFSEDPLRLMRAVQFSVRFGFDIDDSTLRLMRDNCLDIRSIPGARILEELNKIIDKGDCNITKTMNILYDTNMDIALFGKKCVIPNVEGNLDKASFMYLFCKNGGESPSKFYMSRLKGNSVDEKSIEAIESLIDVEDVEEHKLRLAVFNAIKKSDSIMGSTLLNDRVKNIIKLMKRGAIPSNIQQLSINGDDVISIDPTLTGQQVGNVIRTMCTSALMNNYRWNDREKSLKRLRLVMSIIKKANVHLTNT